MKRGMQICFLVPSLPRGPRYSKTFFLGIAIVCVVSGKGDLGLGLGLGSGG